MRYCVLSGRDADAALWAQKLKESELSGWDVALKKAEALSYLGDDAGVLAVWHQEQERGRVQSPGADASMAHLAAVAAWRLGQKKEARRLWKKAQSDAANLLGDEVEDNLEDLDYPVGQSHAPWPFPIHSWLRDSLLHDWSNSIEAISRRRLSEGAEQRAMHKAAFEQLRSHPYLEI